MTTPEEIAEALRGCRHVLLLNHVSPDGDCLGSTLAMARALWRRGQAATVGSADGVPGIYRFLPGADCIRRAVPTDATYDAVVFMECSTPDRAGALAERAASIPLCVNIDHHVSNAGYGQIVYYDASAAAVAELVYPIVRILSPALDRETATCLLCGLLTDTGSFRYAAVTERTLRIAADLVALGASPAEVHAEVYENRPVTALRLLGLALSRLQVSRDGRVAWTVVTQAMLGESGATMEESEGIVGTLRELGGVHVAVLFKEDPDGIRVSLRARDGVHANVIAEAFGGGGHAAAAGFTGRGSLDDVIGRTLEVIERELGTTAASERPWIGRASG